MKLVKRLKDDKLRLKSLRYQINNQDKKQLKYFDNVVKLELKIDYTKLYYQSGNSDKDAFNFNEFGSIVDFLSKTKNWLNNF